MTAEKQEYENLIEPDIKLLKTLLDSTSSNKIGDPITDYLKQYNKLLKQANPNIDELKNFLETNQHSEQTFGIHALELKYQATTMVPTTIEKTMSPYQLYASNSPLWTVKLCANQIESFLDIEKNKGKLSETMFKRTYEYETQGEYCFDIETCGSPYTHSITVYKKG